MKLKERRKKIGKVLADTVFVRTFNQVNPSEGVLYKYNSHPQAFFNIKGSVASEIVRLIKGKD